MKQWRCICSFNICATMLSFSSRFHSASVVNSCTGIGTHTGTTLSLSPVNSFSARESLLAVTSEITLDRTVEVLHDSISAWLSEEASTQESADDDDEKSLEPLMSDADHPSYAPPKPKLDRVIESLAIAP